VGFSPSRILFIAKYLAPPSNNTYNTRGAHGKHYAHSDVRIQRISKYQNGYPNCMPAEAERTQTDSTISRLRDDSLKPPRQRTRRRDRTLCSRRRGRGGRAGRRAGGREGGKMRISSNLRCVVELEFPRSLEMQAEMQAHTRRYK